MSLMNGMKKMCSSVCSFVTYVQALLKHDRLLNTKMQAAIVKKERKEKEKNCLTFCILYIKQEQTFSCTSRLRSFK